MNIDLLELSLKKISELEKKIDTYYQVLKVENELTFILNGSYFLLEELENVINGNY